MTAFPRVCARTMMFAAVASVIVSPLSAQNDAPPPSGTGSGPASGAGNRPRGGVQFDFTDADIRSVIAAIASAGDLDVVYGDIPPRTVSLRMRSPVGRDGYLALLRSVAQSNGLRVTEDGNIITVAAVAPPQQRNPNEQPVPFQNAQLFVYRLKHANATRLAGVLGSIFTGGMPAGSVAAPALSNTGRNQFRNTGGGGIGGNRGQPMQIGIGANGNFSVGGGGGNLAGMLQRAGFNVPGQQGGMASGVMTGQVTIVPEDATNTLLVRADPEDWEIIRQAIEAVDLRPLQVLIEVMIAEVRRSDDLNVGVSVAASNDRTFDGKSRGSVRLRGADTSSNFIFDFTRFGNVDVNVALSALQSRGNVRILSLPLIFAQNNQESRLLVGSQRPFIQTFRTLATDNAARDQVVTYRDVGTSLQILPTINPDGYVNLLVQQEVSSATNEIQFGAPVISTREAMASLFVKDGQTVVVGGLTDNQEEKSRSGIPGLSSLPGVGWLFGTTQKINVRTELFLFLTPHIVQVDADVDRIKKEIQEKSPLLHEMPIVPLITTPMDSTAPKLPTVVEPQRNNDEQNTRDARGTGQPQQMQMPFTFPQRRRGGQPPVGAPVPAQPEGQPQPVPAPAPQPVPAPPPPPPPPADSTRSGQPARDQRVATPQDGQQDSAAQNVRVATEVDAQTILNALTKAIAKRDSTAQVRKETTATQKPKTQ